MLMGANGPMEPCGSRQFRSGPHGTIEGDAPVVGGVLTALEAVGRGAGRLRNRGLVDGAFLARAGARARVELQGLGLALSMLS
jgi:hypothetical protein